MIPVYQLRCYLNFGQQQRIISSEKSAECKAEGNKLSQSGHREHQELNLKTTLAWNWATGFGLDLISHSLYPASSQEKEWADVISVTPSEKLDLCSGLQAVFSLKTKNKAALINSFILMNSQEVRSDDYPLSYMEV